MLSIVFQAGERIYCYFTGKKMARQQSIFVQTPNVELERLRQEIKDDMRQLLNEALEKVLSGC